MPITHEEIDLAKEFLQEQKVGPNGLGEYHFPEHLWRRIVDEFNGFPPIRIDALPEGSIVYPNEPVIQITSTEDGFGELAAHFESKLLQIWAPTERVTAGRHWFEYCKDVIRSVEPDLDETEIDFKASIMLHDFSDRAGMNEVESVELGMAQLLTYPGTDSFCAGFQAWLESGKQAGHSMSVLALAHRNVQAFENEQDCYNTMYEKAPDNSLLSMVSDCNDFFYATENYLIPLAKKSAELNNGKIIVDRPDSGNALEQVLWICRLAKRHGLYTERKINGKTWYFPTTLKFLEGDGMTWNEMRRINDALLKAGFPPYAWGVPYGVGGGLRNGLKRDNLSAKYALSSCGHNNRPVCKFSEDIGKTTLPGPFKLLRSPEALSKRQTIVFEHEDGENAMIEYFNGSRIWEPFGPGQEQTFLTTKERLNKQWNSMPLTLEDNRNQNYPASDAVLQCRLDILEKYAPKKNKDNYFVEQ